MERSTEESRFNRSSAGGTGAYGIEQTLSGQVLEAKTAYELSVEVGNIGTGVARSGELFLLDGFPGQRLELLAGGVVIAVDDDSLAGFIPEYEFMTSTITLDVNHGHLGRELGIRLTNLNQTAFDSVGVSQDLEVDFDDGHLTATAVREPASLMLLALGMLALGRSRSRLGRNIGARSQRRKRESSGPWCPHVRYAPAHR